MLVCCHKIIFLLDFLHTHFKPPVEEGADNTALYSYYTTSLFAFSFQVLFCFHWDDEQPVHENMTDKLKPQKKLSIFIEEL